MSQLIRNGVTLNYREAGSGGPPLLFVHGFGANAEHFAPQLEHFKRRHRVVSIDRRGHGKSDKPEGPYTIPAIAEEVAWTIRELGLQQPVLIVHSMGVIGLELVKQYPDLISALAVIDAPALPPPPVRQHFHELLEGLRTSQYREVIAAACDRLIFLPTDDKARRAALHAAMLETPQHVLVSTWQHFLEYDPVAAAANCRLPLLYIAGVMPFDEAGMRELCPQLLVARTVGAGHFAQLEVPGQVNSMLERFIDLYAPREQAA